MAELEQQKPTTYYVDFENVHNEGLEGIKQLEEESQVVIFYSKKANTISIDQAIDVFDSKADVSFVKIDNGTPNALDFQLVTMLIASLSSERDFVIVSADTGYDAAIKMARRMGLPHITRRSRIGNKATIENPGASQDPPTAHAEEQPETENTADEHLVSASDAGQQSAKAPEQSKPQPEDKADGALSGSESSKPKNSKKRELVNKVLTDAGVNLKQQQLSTVMNALNSTRKRQDFYIHIIKSTGQQPGLSLYRRVRDHYDKLATIVHP